MRAIKLTWQPWWPLTPKTHNFPWNQVTALPNLGNMFQTCFRASLSEKQMFWKWSVYVLERECHDMPSKSTPKIAESVTFFNQEGNFNAVINCICFIWLLLMITLKNGDKKSVFEWLLDVFQLKNDQKK